jgi:hypothetical protein
VRLEPGGEQGGQRDQAATSGDRVDEARDEGDGGERRDGENRQVQARADVARWG